MILKGCWTDCCAFGWEVIAPDSKENLGNLVGGDGEHIEGNMGEPFILMGRGSNKDQGEFRLILPCSWAQAAESTAWELEPAAGTAGHLVAMQPCRASTSRLAAARRWPVQTRRWPGSSTRLGCPHQGTPRGPVLRPLSRALRHGWPAMRSHGKSVLQGARRD